MPDKHTPITSSEIAIRSQVIKPFITHIMCVIRQLEAVIKINQVNFTGGAACP